MELLYFAAAASFITLARAKTGNLPKREFEFAKGQFFWNCCRKLLIQVLVKFPFRQISRFDLKREKCLKGNLKSQKREKSPKGNLKVKREKQAKGNLA